jgi:hypothetical protein
MSSNPSLVIVAGTYDGVLAGWEQHDGRSLELTFATPVHQGSIRSLCLAAAAPSSKLPGTLLSCGYDEMLKTHDWSRRLNSSGEVRTPAGLGTPTCSAFAPPTQASTHCLLGLSGGKLVVYKKRDWSIQHVLAGHEGGIAGVAVHPTGKMAVTGGQADGKLKLWDLTRGRLAYATKLPPSSANKQGKTKHDPVDSLEWSADGTMYGWCCGTHITVKATDSGKDLLDAEVPSRVNQIVFMEGKEGIFVAAACNDGSLPVLAVQAIDSQDERRAILAIEPVDNPVAGEERFKCIRVIDGYRVVTANSAGVVSIMNLEGAVRMIMTDNDGEDNDESNKDEGDESSTDSQEVELAVDIIESVQLGSGARITSLSVWYNPDAADTVEEIDETSEEKVQVAEDPDKPQSKDDKRMKRKAEIEMDSDTVEKARALVSQAKKMNKRKERKRQKQAKD